ncbi:hypothetical protein E2562_008940 [Oryza meyeriana var. granulata]|uniref:Uncharacterized protein n=1 Tax=Oryza meyeriana var. granulata TaxID=110450 RepID=A0A6G1D2F0_9ORYZ|nr:hypothetical protein E2562_008940 [Oryza meyeriana var. granulata]
MDVVGNSKSGTRYPFRLGGGAFAFGVLRTSTDGGRPTISPPRCCLHHGASRGPLRASSSARPARRSPCRRPLGEPCGRAGPEPANKSRVAPSAPTPTPHATVPRAEGNCC